MTVKELIEKLQQLPPDTDVAVGATGGLNQSITDGNQSNVFIARIDGGLLLVFSEEYRQPEYLALDAYLRSER